MKNGELHVISNGKQKPGHFARIARSIHPYVDTIHIREKLKTAKEIADLIRLLTDKGVPLSKIIVNDRIDVAYVTKAKGVQLAHHSLSVDMVKKAFPSLRIGCSIHSTSEAQLAQEQGADYVIFGHVFPTKSKLGKTPKGIEQLELISTEVNIPVIAIGGIHPNHVSQVINAGAKGIAVMSGVLEAKEPIEAVKQYASKLSI
jgi:thiazole tautomerase (transcriptional regulator TenI)